MRFHNSGAGTAYSATNIIGNLQAATAAIPSNVYTKEDLYIYMSPKSYRLYISAISALGYVNAYSMNGDYDAVFEGIKLAVCNGAEDDKLVCAEKSNLFFGTDLLSDSTNMIAQELVEESNMYISQFMTKYYQLHFQHQQGF